MNKMNKNLFRYLPSTKHTLKKKLSHPWTGKQYLFDMNKCTQKQIVDNYTIPYNYTMTHHHLKPHLNQTTEHHSKLKVSCIKERSIPNMPE